MKVETPLARAPVGLELRESLLDAILDVTTEGILVVDDSGKVLRTNRRFQELWRLPDDIVATREDGKLLRYVTDQLADPAAFQEEVQRLYSSQDTSTDSVELADGRVFERFTSPFAFGGPRGRLWSFRDMTETRRAEGALHALSEKLSRVAEGSNDGSWDSDVRTGHVEFSPRYASMLGYDPAELEPSIRTLSALIHPDDAEGAMAALLPIMSGQTDYYFSERRLRHKDGHWVWTQSRGKVVERDAGGHPVRMSGTSTDITDRKRAESDLKEREERFRALVEHSSDLTLILDDAGTITFASPACIDKLGMAPSELVGRSGLGLLHPDDVDVAQASFATLVGSPRVTHELELRMRRADGTWIRMEAKARSMLDVPGVRGVVVNHRDITESSRLRRQVQDSQKLDTIGRLASGVAHDFNNLLTIILCSGEDLRRRLPPEPPSAHECLDDIVSASRRAADLTRQLLVFARNEIITPVSLDLNEVLRNREKLLKRVIGDGIRIVEEFGGDLWAARCDPGLVGQVIMNLALNARDAMPEGGTLTLGTGNVTLGPGDEVPVPGMEPGLYVKLVVRDTGVGMTADVMEHVFEPLFTTKGSGEGTGLGLSVVSGIVKQSKAYLGARSVVGSGTSFEIYFPKDEASDGVPAGVTVAPAGGAETVLVVEDDPKVREVAVRALRSGGYRVLAAAGCDEAVQLARAEPGPLALLVTDLAMPGPGGREVAGRVAELKPGVRVVYISGYTDASVVQAGARWEEGDFLPKPFTSSSLLRVAREVLDRRRGMDA